MATRTALLRVVVSAAAISLTAACAERDASVASEQTLVVYNAGSLARPIRAVFDSFAVGRKLTLQQESTGSLESARKITELGHVPDVIALADAEIFPQFLMPEHVTWYVPFARNRMVLAYRNGLTAAQVPDSTNWPLLLDIEGVRVGRSDPARDPNGYRVLLTLQLAEKASGASGSAARLLTRWGERYIRATSSELVALLQTGEVDYIWAYESVARAANLRFTTLSSTVDLGSDAHAAVYATARARIPGKTVTDSLDIRGAPIRFALSIPRRAPHPQLASEFVTFLMSARGQETLRSAKLDASTDGAVVGNPPEPLARLLPRS